MVFGLMEISESLNFRPAIILFAEVIHDKVICLVGLTSEVIRVGWLFIYSEGEVLELSSLNEQVTFKVHRISLTRNFGFV
jgi:hypothetical protein